MDAVTPAGLPQEPSPYEEDKLWYATSMTVSFGPGGGFRRGLSSACIATSSFPDILGYQTKFLVGYFSYGASMSISSGARRVDARRRGRFPFLVFVVVPISLAPESLDHD